MKPPFLNNAIFKLALSVLGILLGLEGVLGAEKQTRDLKGNLNLTNTFFIPYTGKKLVFLGDSITANGTYTSFIEYQLRVFNHLTPEIISIGVSSETVSGLSEEDHPFPRPWLHERLGRAMSKVQPDMVFACYGMNDGIYHPQDPVRFKAYRRGLEKLMHACQNKKIKAILLTPPPFDYQAKSKKRVHRRSGKGPGDQPTPIKSASDQSPNPDKTGNNKPYVRYSYKVPYPHYDDVLADYSEWLMQLHAPQKGIYCVDLHSGLSQFLEMKKAADKNYLLSKDGIHPSEFGHFLMACIVMMDLENNSGFSDFLNNPKAIQLLEQSFSDISKADLFKLINRKRSLLGNGWRHYVGYKREKVYRPRKMDTVLKQVNKLESEIRSALSG